MIEVGEYVKTHKGDIHKVIGIREEVKEGKRIYSHKAYYLDSKKGSLTEAFIIKHSKNIIDLIEEGDYVNGNIVYEVLDDEVELLSGKIRKKRLHFITGHLIDEDEIKSIITKEKMEEMEYKVKE